MFTITMNDYVIGKVSGVEAAISDYNDVLEIAMSQHLPCQLVEDGVEVIASYNPEEENKKNEDEDEEGNIINEFFYDLLAAFASML